MNTPSMNTPSAVVQQTILNEYRLGHGPDQAVEKIIEIFGQNAINLNTCKHWFRHFRAGNTSLESEPMHISEFVDIHHLLPNEILYDMLNFLDRTEIEKCQLLNKSFKNLILANDKRFPLRTFQKFSIHVNNSTVDVLTTTKEMHTYNFSNSIEVQYLARSLQNCLFKYLEVKDSLVSAKNRPGKVVEILRSLWVYSGEPLRVIEVDSFICIYPFYENVFNDYINSSIIYLEFDPFTELSRFLTNFNNFKLWPLTKKVFIRCCNNQNIGNNVDILLNFFDLQKDGTRLNISLDNINNPSILIPLFEHIITSFEQSADRQKLLNKFGLVRVICPTDIFEIFLTKMNQKMKLTEEIIQEINSEYFGVIKKDGWKLYITIQVKRYPSSYNIVYIHIHTNIIQEIEA